MRAEYDSEADALSIDLIEVDPWDAGEGVGGDYCTVAVAGGRPANVELLSPATNLGLLVVAAKRYGPDREALEAAAGSALAAPTVWWCWRFGPGRRHEPGRGGARGALRGEGSGSHAREPPRADRGRRRA